MRLVRQRYKAGSEIRRGAEPHVVTHGAPDRPTLLSGRVGDPAGRRTPCGTHGAPDRPTPPSRFGDAQDIFCGCCKTGMHCGRPHMRRLSGRVGDPAGRRTPCGTHGAPDRLREHAARFTWQQCIDGYIAC
ncbi:MAG: hypothetical protein K2L90_06655, partial [Muribaculaceae bacterium]|nr:hypothetical protein [Muribaculaceae bacterium]